MSESPSEPKKRGRPQKPENALKKTYNGGGNAKVIPGLASSVSSRVLEESKALICQAIEKGCTPNEACKLLGIPATTYHFWKNSDPVFGDHLVRSQVKLKADIVSKILDHGQKSWQALAWLLQHLPQYKDEFADKSVIKVEESAIQNSSSLVINMINQVLAIKDPQVLANMSPQEQNPTSINLLREAEEEEDPDDN